MAIVLKKEEVHTLRSCIEKSLNFADDHHKELQINQILNCLAIINNVLMQEESVRFLIRICEGRLDWLLEKMTGALIR